MEDLKTRVQRRFPDVPWRFSDEALADTWRWVDDYFGVCAGRRLADVPSSEVPQNTTDMPRLSLTSLSPLDAWGTVFQMRVWERIARIPSGQTLSYTELAQQLGMGKQGSRAVAGACAANPVALLIPCHRVLALNGASSGYRWGIERKQALLQMEIDRRSGVISDPNASLQT